MQRDQAVIPNDMTGALAAVGIGVLAAFSCASPARDASSPPGAPASHAAPTAEPREPIARADAGPADARSIGNVSSPAPLVSVLDFRRVLEAPAHSIGFGKSPRVAVLGEAVWMDRGNGFERLPAPGVITRDVQIFFGRDNAPRLMGFELADGKERGVYRRFRARSWQRARGELGRLGGGAAAPFFGVLGYQDPEVVCRVGQVCIIKRRTGWQTVPPPPGRPRVVLGQDGQAWALAQAALWKLGANGFVAFGGAPPFRAASAVWATSQSDVWVAEPSESTLHHFDGNSWSRVRSPVTGPRDLFATTADDVWLVGDSGAAHFDGQSWRRVAGLPEMLRAVTGRAAQDVWIAGKGGVWHGLEKK